MLDDHYNGAAGVVPGDIILECTQVASQEEEDMEAEEEEDFGGGPPGPPL